MRKIVAVFLILTMLVIFASCGKDSDDDITSTLLTGATISTQPVVSSSIPQSTNTNTGNNVTYILTTSPDKTVPWGETTKFNPSQTVATNPSGGIVINITTEAPTSSPSVNYGTAPATTAPTRYEGTGVDTIDTTTAATTTASTSSWITTTKATTAPPTTKRTAVHVDVNSSGYNSNTGTIIIEVDGSRWISSPDSNSMSLPIYINGSGAGTVRCSLSSKSVGGAYEISVDVSDLELTSGTFSIEFPEGFIENGIGQYSNSFEAIGDIY